MYNKLIIIAMCLPLYSFGDAHFKSLIDKAAIKYEVPPTLLYAICAHESGNFKYNYVQKDNGSPSVGICMVKEKTAIFLGFKGTEQELLKPEINIKWAAKYLKYQLKRYKNDYCKAVGAYNAGSYISSKQKPWRPFNTRYLHKVGAYLDDTSKFTCLNPLFTPSFIELESNNK